MEPSYRASKGVLMTEDLLDRLHRSQPLARGPYRSLIDNSILEIEQLRKITDILTRQLMKRMMNVGETKRCAKCWRCLPLTNFGHDGRTRDRLTYRCDDCRKKVGDGSGAVISPAHFHGEH